MGVQHQPQPSLNMKFLVLAASLSLSSAQLVYYPNGALTPIDEPAVAYARAQHLAAHAQLYADQGIYDFYNLVPSLYATMPNMPNQPNKANKPAVATQENDENKANKPAVAAVATQENKANQENKPAQGRFDLYYAGSPYVAASPYNYLPTVSLGYPYPPFSSNLPYVYGGVYG